MRLDAEFKSLITIGIILCLTIADHSRANQTSWPQVATMKKSFNFPSAHNASAKFNIASKDGKPLYEVECHTASYEGDPDFDYSGDFECRLKSLYSKDAYSTLFTDNPKQSRDWESRARVFAEELIGQCGDYPEYGRIRHFRLRGMKITLEFSELSFTARQGGDVKRGKDQELVSFRFDFSLEPDGTALSPIAEIVPYLEPPFVNPKDPNDFTRKCDKVIKRKD